MSLDTNLSPTLTDRAAECARLCANLTSDCGLFVDVSVGRATFADCLPRPTVSIDAGVGGSESRTWTPPYVRGPVAVVGIPPFGADGAAPLAYINHAVGFADYVAFLLPADFARNSMKDQVDPFVELLFEQVFPDQVAEVDDALQPVNLVFQVWRKETRHRRDAEEIAGHPDFEFVADPGDAHFVVKGVRRGRL